MVALSLDGRDAHRGDRANLQTELRNDASSRTSQLVNLLYELGPDIPEISRRLGQYKESVRYRYKEKILAKGFAVNASVDNERLGLKRMILVLDFSKEFEPFAESILSVMNELCYLVSYAKTFLGGFYIVNESVPTEYVEDVRQFFLQMKEEGMFTKVETLEFDWARQVPMKADCYDFNTGRWDFDLSAESDFRSATYSPSTPARFDYVDLLILKELQINADRSLKEISERLDLNYKKLVWHYTTHVVGRRLIRGYSVNWMGTRYDYKLERALHRKHSYFAMGLFAKNLSTEEVMSLRQKIDRLPFLWFEASGKDYFAEFSFPVDHMVEGIEYLSDAIVDLEGRVQVYPINQTKAAAFTIPYSLFDLRQKRWVFDGPGLADRFQQLLVRIKNETR
jgi:hypothetical protein